MEKKKKEKKKIELKDESNNRNKENHHKGTKQKGRTGLKTAKERNEISKSIHSFQHGSDSVFKLFLFY